MVGITELADLVLAIIGILFAAVLIPALISSKTKITRISSGLTFLGLYVTALCYVILGLNIAAGAAFGGGTVWFLMFIWRS